MRKIALAALLPLLLLSTADALAARSKQQLWGAIAYSTKTGAYGYAVDMKTKRDAEAGAFRQCGNDCDQIKSFRNNCGAVVQDGKKFGWSTGASREIAEQKAAQKCATAGCKTLVWACTTER
jgi:hypothetical protein